MEPFIKVGGLCTAPDGSVHVNVTLEVNGVTKKSVWLLKHFFWGPRFECIKGCGNLLWRHRNEILEALEPRLEEYKKIRAQRKRTDPSQLRLL